MKSSSLDGINCFLFCKTLLQHPHGSVPFQLVCIFLSRLKQKDSTQPLTLELSMQKSKQDVLMKEN